MQLSASQEEFVIFPERTRIREGNCRRWRNRRRDLNSTSYKSTTTYDERSSGGAENRHLFEPVGQASESATNLWYQTRKRFAASCCREPLFCKVEATGFEPEA